MSALPCQRGVRPPAAGGFPTACALGKEPPSGNATADNNAINGASRANQVSRKTLGRGSGAYRHNARGSPMSIYATLWQLKFPPSVTTTRAARWTEVRAQGVPGHIGTPTPGHGYESGDPFADFLPPAIVLAPDDDGRRPFALSLSFATERPRLASATWIDSSH